VYEKVSILWHLKGRLLIVSKTKWSSIEGCIKSVNIAFKIKMYTCPMVAYIAISIFKIILFATYHVDT